MPTVQALKQTAVMPRRRRPGEEETVQLAFRLPASLVKALDEEIERLAPPGMSITRTDVVRVLLMEALAEREARRKK